jgi:hypothetical protein
VRANRLVRDRSAKLLEMDGEEHAATSLHDGDGRAKGKMQPAPPVNLNIYTVYVQAQIANIVNNRTTNAKNITLYQ